MFGVQKSVHSDPEKSFGVFSFQKTTMTKFLPTHNNIIMWKKPILNKIVVSLLFCLSFIGTSVFAQVGRGITYTDSYLFGPYPALGLATGTAFAALTDDAISPAYSTGVFTVSFGGVNYSSFHISSNGFIILSNAAAGSAAPIGSTPVNNLAAIPAGSGPLIAPLWDDLSVTGAAYRVAGTAASGFLAVEWTGISWDKNAASPYLAKMQLRMYSSAHTTLAGRIQFYYQPIVATLPQSYGPYSGTSGGASIGIADACGGDYYSVGPATIYGSNLPAWSNGTASKSINTSNISNLGDANTVAVQVQTVQFDKAPPANDQCAGFRDLGTIPAGACTPTIGTLIGATNTGTPAGPCDAANTNDVWFRVTKPANTTSFRVTTDFAAFCKSVTTSVEVYTGVCGTLTSIGCSTNGGTINANNAIVNISDPTNSCAAVNYYIRVAGDASAQGEFTICVENFAASNCGNATVIPTTLPQTYTCQTTCGSVNDYNSTMGCLSTYMNGEDFVYSYTPTSLVNSCISISVSGTGASSNPGIFVLNNCPNAGGVVCLASATSAGPTVSISSVSLTIGTTYYIVISNNNTPACIPFNITIASAGLAPGNDDPCQAGVPNLTVGGATCTWTNGGYSSNCASATAAVPAPGCGNYNGGDIWFRFTVPASGNVLIDTRPGASNPMGDAAMAAYAAGGCGGPFTLISCASAGSSANALYPQLSLTGRTPGETIWLRVWSENNSSSGSIEFCLSTACIAYDEPCGATPLTVTTGGVPVYSTFTNVCATTSVGMPGNTCATAPRIDVWIRIIVPPSGGVTITGLVGPTVGGMRDPVLQVYRGTCTALVQVACNDDAGPGLAPEITLCGGLTPGETLWLRIWPYGTTLPANEGTFELAAYETSPASAPNPYQQDEPCNITTNFPVTNGTCVSYTTLSLRCQTPTATTAGIPAPVNCDPFWAPGFDPSNDTWVRIQVPPGITTANFLTVAGSVTDDQMVVYRATNCSTLTQLACDDLSGPGLMPYISLGGLIPGEFLYIRHYIWHGGTTRTGDFGFCVETPCSTAVVNDNPCQAIALTVNTGCVYAPYTTSCATNTVQGGVPATVATCGNFNTSSRDVWFTITVPASGQISIDMRSINIPDALMAVYSAPNCSGTFTQIACNDNSSVNPAMPYLLLTGQTPGAVLYVRVWAKNGLSGGFELCVVDQCPSGPPSNDQPCNALALTLGTSYNGYNSCSDGTNEPYPPTGAGAAPGCWANPGGAADLNTVWYTFTAPPSGQVRIRTTLGSLTNTQIALYQGSFCFSLTPYGGTNCNDDYSQCGVTTTASELIATGLTPGVVYYVVVDGRNGLTGTFGITIYDNSLPAVPIAQQDCVLPTQICAQQTTFGAPGFQGAGNICDLGPGGSAYGCVPATGARENNSAFFTFTIATNGVLFFDITPTSNINYDWVLWNISGQTTTAACAAIMANTQTITSCNYSTTGGSTGMQSIGLCTFCMTTDGPYSRDIIVTAGETYMLMINNTSGLTAGFTLDFGPSSPVLFGSPSVLNWSGGANSDWSNVNNWGGCGSPSCVTNASIAAGPLNQPVITANEQVKDINITGILTIGPGVTLQICGNYTNTGTLNADPTSTIEFIGGANQTINGNITGASRFPNLVINKSGGNVQMNADVEVGTNFTTSNGTSVFNCNGYTLSVARNFNNFNGTSTFQSPAASRLRFIGNSPQTFTNINSNLTLNHVTMAQTINSSVTLSAGAFNNMTLGTSGILTLTNGKIITGANEVVITNTAGAAATIGGNTSFVEGWLRRYFGTSLASYEFPVGEATQGWERATLEFTTPPSAPYNLVMRFLRWGGANLPLVNGPFPPYECANYDWSQRPALNHGYWNSISSTATPTGEYTLTLWNRTYSNYVGTVTPASISHPLSVAQGAPGTVLTFASTTTPGFPALAVGMNVLGFAIPAGATIAAITPTTVTLSVPTMLALPIGTFINFFSPGAAGSFAALTVMKDVNGTGSWTMEATCPCNPTFPPPPKPTSRRYAYNAATSGFFNFATVQFGTALPIELISFDAKNVEGGNLCSWVTASETNNDYFILERSFDGENFSKVAQINGFGAGTTTETREYSYTDTEPCDGVVYYRLQQVDIDGANSYSDIVALNCLKSKEALSVFPNPARAVINYSFYEEEEGVINVQILDVYGKLVSWERNSTQRGANNMQSNVENLAPGVYYLKLDRMDKNSNVRQIRFVKN
ncbi:MAG: T9SS type A sorting domain-containing protein [Bacteroidetes bacterium]|nr:MAG: T9SS type A sorting domain-containing protein [Bacteroidota bacterium]